MAIISLTSASGAPGVTTTAVALALHWPRPVVLVEADLSHTSSVLPGWFRGQMPHTRGLTGLAQSHQSLSWDALRAQSIQLTADTPDRIFVPGFQNLAAAAGSQNLWRPLADLLDSLAVTGTDVIVDLGRWQPHDPRGPVAMLSAATVLMLRPILTDVAAARSPLSDLHALLAPVGHGGWMHALLQAHPDGYGHREVSAALGVPIVDQLPHDARSAAAWSLGSQTRSNKLIQPIKRLADRLIEQAQAVTIRGGRTHG